MSDFFEPDFSEAPEREPAPAGKYEFNVRGNPKLCKSQKGNAYLTWELEHTDANLKRHGLVFERTMLTGKGAFRLRDILKALGAAEADAKSLKIKPLAPLTEESAKKGVGVEMNLRGEVWEPAGSMITATLKIDQGDGTNPARNVVERYLAPAA